jgi:cytochrome P450
VDDPLDPFSPAASLDPHPVYRRLREEAPVRYQPAMDAWTVARHADVVEVLRDARTFSSELGMGELISGRLVPGQESQISFGEALGPMRLVIAADPPDHTKLRRLVSAPFAAREMAALEPRIRALCAELVDELVAADEPDLIGHVGWPLPVTVIAEVLGIPGERRADFRRWSTDMVGGLSGSLDLAARAQSATEMFEFFVSAIAERQLDPGTDAISTLVSRASVLDGDDALTVPELVAFCILLLVAGNETTTNLIGGGLHSLLTNPDAMQALRERPAAMPNAVEEMLRYDSPVQGLVRFARNDVEVGGTQIHAGDIVICMLGAANRDPGQFPDPERFDIDRTDIRHLSFGYGIHYCVGAPLARAEAEIALRAVLARWDGIELGGQVEMGGTFLIRGPQRLPVSVGART